MPVITFDTPLNEINNFLTRRIEIIKSELVRRLIRIGEKVVNTARNLPSPNAAQIQLPNGKIPPHQPNYIDWSANLRSSIGYAVVVEGEIVQISDFEPIDNGVEGAERGREYVKQLTSEFPQGIALIVVAGEQYASYVTNKGYDVLDTAELEAKKLITEMVNKLKAKIYG